VSVIELTCQRITNRRMETNRPIDQTNAKRQDCPFHSHQWITNMKGAYRMYSDSTSGMALSFDQGERGETSRKRGEETIIVQKVVRFFLLHFPSFNKTSETAPMPLESKCKCKSGGPQKAATKDPHLPASQAQRLCPRVSDKKQCRRVVLLMFTNLHKATRFLLD
jgi:hypothetical protein